MTKSDGVPSVIHKVIKPKSHFLAKTATPADAIHRPIVCPIIPQAWRAKSCLALVAVFAMRAVVLGGNFVDV